LETFTSFTSHIAVRVMKDKRLTYRYLQRAGISVAEQHVFAQDGIDAAREIVRKLGSAVVKPVDGNKGRGVSVGVTLETLEDAWAAARAATSGRLLVEREFRNGIEARYLVIDGTCVSVVRRIPPHVYGDGQQSVAQLVEARNAQRRRNPSIAGRPILIDSHRQHVLRQQGLDMHSVPAAGQLVLIDRKAGLSTGGEPMEITADVHPEMLGIAERASRVVPGLDIVGFDILALDHGAKPDPSNYIVIEGNTRPGVSGHTYPSYGPPRNVCRLIAEYCLRRMNGGTTATASSE
ncbi:MAG TPA: hypothetical protein VLA78_14975, partial [Paracoccaceae bacterium]|nr:hypothetical protein [Paracoccaceae bacterium]